MQQSIISSSSRFSDVCFFLRRVFARLLLVQVISLTNRYLMHISDPPSPSDPSMNQNRLTVPIAATPPIPSVPIKSIFPAFLIHIASHIHVPLILNPLPSMTRQ